MDQIETLVQQEVKRQEKAVRDSDKRNIIGTLLASKQDILDKTVNEDTLKALIDRAEKIATLINERI